MKQYKTQLTIKLSEDDLYSDMDLAFILKVGNIVIVYDNTNDITGTKVFGIMEDNGEGIPHIMNRSSLQYHGYRGTYCGISKHGHGLRKITKIIYEKKSHGDVFIKVVLGPDLVPDKP